MATLNDIANVLGVSKSTVSKGLHNATDISEEMRRKILETAVELGYTSKRLSGNERKVCILIENMDYENPNQFGYDIILGFKQLAEPDGIKVDVVQVTPEFQQLNPYSVFMLQQGYQASFVLGFSLLDPWMQEFRTCRVPTILYDNYIKENPYIASVGCDSQEGFELSVKHLANLGHKKIGLISGPLESYILRARYHAYTMALKKYNLEVNDNYIGLQYYVSKSTQEYIPKLYAAGVTAILFSHDVRALSAIAECDSLGIRIPEDLSLVGFDDLPMAACSKPPLTTIRQDRIALGKCGFYAMNSLLGNVPIGSILLRAQLILRQSTGEAPKRQQAAALPE